MINTQVRGLTVTIGGMAVPVDGLTVELPESNGGGVGPMGPMGPAGPMGPVGPMGPAGPAGVGSASGVTDQIGEWTPIIGGTGGESGQSYHFQTGHYWRMGRLVCLWAYTQFSSTGEIVGALELKGFPFPTRNLPGYFGGLCSYFSNFSPNASQVSSVTLYAAGGQTRGGLYGVIPGGNPRPLNGGDINHATQFVLSLVYRTDD